MLGECFNASLRKHDNVDNPSPIKFEQILVEGEVTVGGMMK